MKRRWWLALALGAYVLGFMITWPRAETSRADEAAVSSEQRSPEPADAPATRQVRAQPSGADSRNVTVEEAPPSKYHARDPYEWQGRAVNLTWMARCTDFCGLAMACIDGRCGPCTEDAQCLAGETCVLDHCLLSDQVECVSRSECEPGADEGPEYCVIGGLSGGLRGNENLRSFCRGSKGPNPDTARGDFQAAKLDRMREQPTVVPPQDPMGYRSLQEQLSSLDVGAIDANEAVRGAARADSEVEDEAQVAPR